MACKTLANARTAPAPRSQLVARTAPRRVTSLQPRPQHLRAVLAGAGGDGCCGGGAPASSSAQDKASSGGGCGCSGSSAPGGQGVAMQQLSSMMGGMEGSLTRQDMQAAMEAAGTQRGGGERFLEIGSILRSSGVGGDEDDEAELDALVV